MLIGEGVLPTASAPVHAVTSIDAAGAHLSTKFHLKFRNNAGFEKYKQIKYDKTSYICGFRGPVSGVLKEREESGGLRAEG